MKASAPNHMVKASAAWRRWRRFWRTFLWVRLTVWVVLLVIVTALYHVSEIGLPGPVKQRFLAELRQYGWTVDFARLRWRWAEGFVMEDLCAERAGETGGIVFFVTEAQCRLEASELRRFRWRIESLQLREARCVWMVSSTNAPRRYLDLSEMGGTLRFRPDDRLVFEDLHGRSLGAQLKLQGELIHASGVRHWRFGRRAARWDVSQANRWRRILEEVNKVEIAGVPEVVCDFKADALRLEALEVRLTLNARAFESPWASGSNAQVSAQLFPAAQGAGPWQVELSASVDQLESRRVRAEAVRCYMNVEATTDLVVPTNINLAVEWQGGQTDWGRASMGVVTVRSALDPTNSQRRLSEVSCQGENVITSWGRSVQVRAQLAASHPMGAPWPAQWRGSVGGREVETRWVHSAAVQLHGHGALPEGAFWGATNLAWPERLRDVLAHCSGGLTNVQTSRLDLDWLKFDTDWAYPVAHVQVDGLVAEGLVGLSATLDTESRVAVFQGQSRSDPREVAHLLSTNVQGWLAQCSWEEPPRLQVSGSVTVPPFPEWGRDWGQRVWPTVSLQGSVQVGSAACRGFSFVSANGTFDYQQSAFNVPGLRIRRPEGFVEASGNLDRRSRGFRVRVKSQILPQALRPLLPVRAGQDPFKHLEFRSPPLIEGELWGDYADWKRLGARGWVGATNFSIRGEPLGWATARVSYTNQWLQLDRPEVFRTGMETARAAAVWIDLATEKIYLTNAVGWVSLAPVSRMISPQAERAMAPFFFDRPVQGLVEGVVDIKRKRYEYDLDFKVQGGAFRWERFRLPLVSTQLRWRGQTLAVTNTSGQFYDGQAEGWAFFDFAAPQGADFAFTVRVTNVNFHTLTEDLAARTNLLEGQLSGDLIVRRANTADWRSWQGGGMVLLRDGLIWDIPMFGVFSPVLNTIVPGLGNSRARRATAAYTITNSIIDTRDLEVSATAMRMQFRGQCDFQRRIDGRMEGELLRDMPGIGIVLSRVLWPVTKLFEYKLRGTVEQPETEPVFIISKIVLLPLNPIKGFRDLFLPGRRPPKPGAGREVEP